MVMSSSNKRGSNLTKSVTDGSGATYFYDVLNGASVDGGCDAGRISFVRGVLMEPTKIESVVRLATPDAKLLLLAGRWRARAKEILLQAETMNDADARQKMLEVAANYERLAQRVEQRSGRPRGQSL
jgi:hypothetical protein